MKTCDIGQKLIRIGVQVCSYVLGTRHACTIARWINEDPLISHWFLSAVLVRFPGIKTGPRTSLSSSTAHTFNFSKYWVRYWETAVGMVLVIGGMVSREIRLVNDYFSREIRIYITLSSTTHANSYHLAKYPKRISLWVSTW